MKPLISIIIPNFNREEAIFETVCNALEQSYQNIEVIVVDDCSEDNSVQVLKKIMDSRFRCIESDWHRGANACRNAGVRASHGEYIAFQDSGTLWTYDKLEKQLERIDGENGVGLVYCMIESEQDGTCTPEKALEMVYKEEKCAEVLVKGNMIDTPTIMVTRECFEKVGGFDEDLLRWQDYDFVIRVVQDYRIVIVNEVLAKTKQFQNSISSNYDFLLKSIPVIIKKNRMFFERFGGIDDLIHGVVEMIVNSGLPYSVSRDYCVYLQEQLQEIYVGGVNKYFDMEMQKIVKRDSFNNVLVLYNFQNFMKSIHEKNPFYIFGAGVYARRLIARFKEIGCFAMIEKVIVTKKTDKGIDSLEGIPIIQIDALEEIEDKPILIGTSEKMQMEVFQILCSKRYKNIVILQDIFWKYIV